MRYYQDEHESAYRRIEQLGYSQWNDLFDQGRMWTYDNFQNRSFLEHAIPQLGLPAGSAPDVFEYGCGTGPAACFLAARGFQVDAVDLIPQAIAIASRMAEERGVRVNFRVADICALAAESVSRQYDLVLDSYCLQSIVTDEDRAAIFSAVRARLKPTGHYLISTAMHGPGRTYEPGTYDASTGICFREVPAGSAVEHVRKINGRWYIPHRRHLSADALLGELEAAGFQVLSFNRSDDGGNVVCRLDQSLHRLSGRQGSGGVAK